MGFGSPRGKLRKKCPPQSSEKSPGVGGRTSAGRSIRNDRLLDEALVDFAGARAVVAGGVGEVLDGGLGEGREGLALRGPGGAEGVLGEGAGGDVEGRFRSAT